MCSEKPRLRSQLGQLDDGLEYAQKYQLRGQLAQLNWATAEHELTSARATAAYVHANP
jgi:hypothetical protein